MMRLFKKEQIESKRTFSYSKGGTNLSFTLNLGDKGQMKNFLELLEIAVVEVKEEIERRTT